MSPSQRGIMWPFHLKKATPVTLHPSDFLCRACSFILWLLHPSFLLLPSPYWAGVSVMAGNWAVTVLAWPGWLLDKHHGN